MATDEHRQAREQRLSQKCLQHATTCLHQRDYGRAFARYLLVLKLSPDLKSDIRENFTLALREWGEELETSGRVTDLLQCYDQACQLFPECEAILSNMGAQLFRLGYIDEAASCFRKALRLNPDFLTACINLENVCGHLVERWHFRMLNDRRRNAAYQEAIVKAVHAGCDNVLDIGTGTGILSMLAVRAGATSVYACEMSKTMFEVATDIVTANGMSTNIHMIHKNSKDLTIPEDIPNRVSLVVTEIFDAGLIGEQTLSTIHHAWKHLLQNCETDVKPRLLPSGATVFVCAVESESIRKQNRFLYPGLPHLDLSDVDIVCQTGMSAETEEEFEPYTSERLSHLRSGYKFLTAPVEFQRINFNDPEALEESLTGGQQQLCLSVNCNGRLDAIAVWFHLHLDDSLSLNSGPDAGSCWEQAIFPVLPRHLTDTGVTRVNFAVRYDDELNINCVFNGSCFRFMCTGIVHSSPVGGMQQPSRACKDICDKRCQLDDARDMEVNENCKKPPMDNHDPFVGLQSNTDVQAIDRALYLLDRTELGRLNDIHFNKAYISAVQTLLSQAPSAQHSILDLTQGFSPLAVQALKLGADYAHVVTENPTHKALLQVIAASNSVDPNRLSFSSCSFHELNREWSVIVSELVDPCGCLQQQVLENIALASVTCLVPGGAVVPSMARVYAMLIESDSLHADSAVVSDDNTLDLHIADSINLFQMTTHVDIELCKLPYKKLSDTFELFTFDFTEAHDDQVAAFLSQEHSLEVTAIDTGVVTAVVYWFDLTLTPDLNLCTLDPKLHWRQAAVVHRAPLGVSCGTQMEVSAACKNSCIRVGVSLV